jgi:hypothetical protein
MASKMGEFRKIAGDFETMLKGVVQTVAVASTEMKATGWTMGDTEEGTSPTAAAGCGRG